jgi:hypothetical protein
VAVRGNHLVNKAGTTIRLLGVDRSGSEYMCLGGSEVFDGPTGRTAVAAMAAWHIDAVRVPLNEDCWLGINGVNPAVSGAAYRQAIEKYVATLQSSTCTGRHRAPTSPTASGRWPTPTTLRHSGPRSQRRSGPTTA